MRIPARSVQLSVRSRSQMRVRARTTVLYRIEGSVCLHPPLAMKAAPCKPGVLLSSEREE